MKIPEHIDSSFWAKERSKELPFVHDDPVSVSTDAGEKTGSVVFIAKFHDGPVYFVEFADGTGIQVTASQLALVQ